MQVAPGAHQNGLSAFDRQNVNTVQASTSNLLGNAGGRSLHNAIHHDQRFLGPGSAIEDVGDSVMTGVPMSDARGALGGTANRTDSKQR